MQMADAKPNPVFTMKMSSTSPSHARTDISVRDVETVVDEPEVRGGTNLGPSPTEFQLAALMSCTNVISNRLAHKMGLEYEGVSIEAECDFDRRGALIEAEVDTPFVAVRLAITVNSNATDEQIQQISDDLAKYCPIEKTMSGSGTKITKTWTVNRG